MEFVIVLVLLVVVVLVVTGPLRRAHEPAGSGPPEPGRDSTVGVDSAAAAQLAELEAAREAKYREIRDADLDHRTGKLSDADYAAIDQTLRAQAVEIMHAIDRTRAEGKPDSAA